MLLGVTYQEAFSKLFPGEYMPCPETFPDARVGRPIEESLEFLPTIGLKIKKANLRNIKSLRKRTSLILLRWKSEPWLSHGLVFDGEVGIILDPAYEETSSLRFYNSNLETIYYVKRVSNELPIRNTDPGGDQGASGLPNGGGLSSSETPTGDALFI